MKPGIPGLTKPIIGRTFISGAEIPIQRFVSMPPNIHATGDIKLMSLLAGQSVGLVDEIRPAAEILRETVNGAERLIRELSAKVFAGQARLIELGFRQGGLAGYGFRRLLVVEHRNSKGVLKSGERKSIASDRIVLIPGPANEIAIVREIFH